MSSYRRMSISRGSIVGQSDGASFIEPLRANHRRSIALDDTKNEQRSDDIDFDISASNTGRRLSIFRVNIVDQEVTKTFQTEDMEASGTQDKDAAPDNSNSEEKNAWSKDYMGIPINYFSVGLVYGGSVNLLYPVLVIQNGVTSSFISAAASMVTVFWSYKIFFGILSDCFPIFRRRWKWYMVLGWVLCAAVLVGLVSMGEDISPTNLVVSI